MKTRIVIFTVSLLLLTGCPGGIEVRRDVLADATVMKRDGCEYLVAYYDRSMCITHKGDCSNPIHKTL